MKRRGNEDRPIRQPRPRTRTSHQKSLNNRTMAAAAPNIVYWNTNIFPARAESDLAQRTLDGERPSRASTDHRRFQQRPSSIVLRVDIAPRPKYQCCVSSSRRSLDPSSVGRRRCNDAVNPRAQHVIPPSIFPHHATRSPSPSHRPSSIIDPVSRTTIAS